MHSLIFRRSFTTWAYIRIRVLPYVLRAEAKMYDPVILEYWGGLTDVGKAEFNKYLVESRTWLRLIFAPIGKNRNGDVMRDVFRGVSLIVVGFVAAIIVYPFLHELGHLIAAWISGAEIYEFSILPVPNVLCRFDSTDLRSTVIVGFGGIIFPSALTGLRVPKKFMTWYLWFTLKCICILSFVVSLWALIFYQTGIEIANDDMTRVMQFAPEFRMLYIIAIVQMLAITLLQLIRSKPLSRCMRYFDA